MAPVLKFLLAMKQAGHACILVHHSDKGGNNFRGSSAIATTFEVILGLRRLDGRGAGEGAGFELAWEKYRGRPTAATRDMDVTLDGEPPQWTHKPAARGDMMALVDAVRSCKFTSQRKLAEYLGWDASRVSRIKARAIGRKEITGEEWRECLKGDFGDAAEELNPDF